MRNKYLMALLSGLLLLGMAGVGNALIINLDSYENTSANAIGVLLDAGTYTITPIEDEYTAWNAWGYVNLPNQGWINNYSFAIGSSFQTISDGGKYATPEEALANALSASFTLATDGFVNFYIGDSYYADNIGGMSLDVSLASVPEPATILLLGAGLVGLVTVNRKRFFVK